MTRTIEGRVFTGYLTAIRTQRGSGLATLYLRTGGTPETAEPMTTCFCDAGSGLRMLDAVLGFSQDLAAATARRMRWEIDSLGLLDAITEADDA